MPGLICELPNDLLASVCGFLDRLEDVLALLSTSANLRRRLSPLLQLQRLQLETVAEIDGLSRLVQLAPGLSLRSLALSDFLSPTPDRLQLFRQLLPGLRALGFWGCVAPKELGGVLPSLELLRTELDPADADLPHDGGGQRPRVTELRSLSSRRSGPVATQLLQLAPRLCTQLRGLHLDWVADVPGEANIAEQLLQPLASEQLLCNPGDLMDRLADGRLIPSFPNLQTLALVETGPLLDLAGWLRVMPRLSHLSLAGCGLEPDALLEGLREHCLRFPGALRWLDLTHVDRPVGDRIRATLSVEAADVLVTDLSQLEDLREVHGRLQRPEQRLPESFPDWIAAVVSSRDPQSVPLLNAYCSSPEQLILGGGDDSEEEAKAPEAAAATPRAERLNAVEFLLQLGANISLTDSRGRGAMAAACRFGQAAAARSLISARGARTVLHVAASGRQECPLVLAALYGYADVVRELLGSPELVQLHTDPEHFPLLYRYDNPTTVACAARNLEVLHLLVQHRICLSLPDEFGQEPLKVAIKTGFVAGVQLLLEAGAAETLSSRRKTGGGARNAAAAATAVAAAPVIIGGEAEEWVPRWVQEAAEIQQLLVAHNLPQLAHIRPIQEAGRRPTRRRARA